MVIETVKRKCAICSTVEFYDTLFSCNEEGYRELDFRPAPPLGDSLGFLIESCPKCGYVAHNISIANEPEKVARLIRSRRYKTCDGKKIHSEVAKRYYQNYILTRDSAQDITIFRILRNVIWACDDDPEDDSIAIELRNILIHMITTILVEPIDGSFPVSRKELELIKLDYLRRNMSFQKVIYEIESDLPRTSNAYDCIREYQRYLSKKEEGSLGTRICVL